MKKLNSKGFGAIEAVLTVLILAIIGGTGYYVYSQNQDKKVSTANTTQNNQKETIPEGWVEYKNDKLVEGRNLGLSFIYPEEFGEATAYAVQEGPLNKKTGFYETDYIEIRFEKAGDNFTIKADNQYGFTKDREIYDSLTGIGMDASRNDEKGFEVINDRAIFWYQQEPSEGTESVYTTIFGSLNLLNSDYKGIEILYTLKSGVRAEKQTAPPTPTTQAEIDDAMQEMKTIIESFKEI